MKPNGWSAGGGHPQVSQRRKASYRWAWFVLLAAACAIAGWLYIRPAHLPDFVSHDERAQAMPWKLALGEPETTPVIPKGPEATVRQIYEYLGEGQRQKALMLAEHLASTYPTFQLGQLLYADLLNIGLREPVEGPDLAEEALPAAQKRLQELLTETRRRLFRPAPSDIAARVPAGLIHLDPVHHPYVAVVDASHSRLYWFANRSTPDGQARLELMMETYVSVGHQGLGKSKEGDGRTPVGVYFIQKNLPGQTLPDLFGEGALTLNYPNAVDVIRKRTGSGIWLHGTPSAQYSRAPEASDGCVVLSNPEMAQLLELGALKLTPVLIDQKTQWLPPEQEAADRREWITRLQAWNQSRLQGDEAQLREHYSPRFERDGLGLDQWWGRLRPTGSKRHPRKPLELLSALRWQDGEEWMVVTWRDPNAGRNRSREFLRTYWARDGEQWKIVFEGPV